MLFRFSDARGPIRDIIGEDEAKKVPPIWGLNEEGEIRTAWREVGLPNVWYMMGNLAWSRFYSKHLALRECPPVHLSYVSSPTLSAGRAIDRPLTAHVQPLGGSSAPPPFGVVSPSSDVVPSGC